MPVNRKRTGIQIATTCLTGVALLATAGTVLAEDTEQPSLALLEYLGTFTTPEGDYMDPIELEQMAQAGGQEEASAPSEPANSEENE